MTHSKNSAAIPEIYDLIKKAEVLPDEDPIAFDHLRRAFLSDLSPATPYEVSLVEKIINMEWEIQRLRRISYTTLLVAFRGVAIIVFEQGEIGEAFDGQESNAAAKLGYDLVGSNDTRQRAARAKLAEYQVSETEIMATAYLEVIDVIERYDMKILNLERRRRQLYDDFIGLKKARQRHQVSVTDAEVVE
jgi:hypothetical protein